MGDTPVLMLDGELKGQIRHLENPDLGLVSVERTEDNGDGSFFNLADYHQIHYRTRRFHFLDRTAVVGWCGVDPQPPTDAVLELLFSDLAKQLLKLTETEKVI